MRILFVHEYLGAHGGAETDIRLTALEFRKRGHTSGLIFAQGTGKNEVDWRDAFSDCFQLRQENPCGSASAALKVFSPDVIYFYGLGNTGVFATLLAPGIPTARRVQDHALYCMRGYKYNPLTRAICRRPASARCIFPCLAFLGRNRNGRFPIKWVSYGEKRSEMELSRQCRRLIVYSQYQKDELIRNGYDPHRIFIHVPLNFQGAQAPRSTLSNRNLIVYAGQIIRGKGVDLLLQALAKVRLPFECVILGDGSDRANCERLCARLGLGGRVQFRGFVRAEELTAYYQEASVAAVSSVWPEPFGMAGPEAMLHGLPVVAFDAGGIREWLLDGENGFLVPWMDTDSFAERMEDLLRDKELARRLGDRGRELVNGQYDPERQFNHLERLFLSLCQQAQTTTDENNSRTVAHELCR